MAYGELELAPGVEFANREELHRLGLHRHMRAGIAGYGRTGLAESIVFSGGYRHDRFESGFVQYTGDTGRDARTGRQIEDQRRIRGNAALIRNHDEGVRVRVFRLVGPKGGPYRYEGLYTVAEWDYVRPPDDEFYVFLYTLEPADSVAAIGAPARRSSLAEPPEGEDDPGRGAMAGTRVLRNTAVTRWVKEAHDYTCQVCGTRLLTPGGPYAEGAHIKPLGQPHNGKDIVENVLCLCPNCHVLFDEVTFTIDEGGSLTHTGEPLRSARRHAVGPEYVDYHRELWRRKQLLVDRELGE